MSDSVENIEARIAAYIDGELTPAAAAEIEQHLFANPAHRALVEDLKRHKALIGALPRELAPGDLGEPVQGQLERSALLDDGTDDHAALLSGPIRINRWPQRFSAAAIILLSAGLGMLVYKILPPKHPPLAIQDAPSADRERLADSNRSSGLAGGADDMAAPSEARAEKASNKELALATPSRRASKSGPGEEAMADGIARRALGGGGAGGGASANKLGTDQALPLIDNQTVLITVLATNVHQANAQLVGYLRDNNIAWSTGQAPAANAAAVDAAEDKKADLLDRKTQAPSSPKPAAAAAEFAAARPAPLEFQKRSGDAELPKGSSAAAITADTAPQPATRPIQVAAVAERHDLPPDKDSVPSGQHLDELNQLRQAANTSDGQQFRAAQASAIAGTLREPATAGQQVIVARDLNLAQLDALTTALRSEQAQGQARGIEVRVEPAAISRNVDVSAGDDARARSKPMQKFEADKAPAPEAAALEAAGPDVAAATTRPAVAPSAALPPAPATPDDRPRLFAQQGKGTAPADRNIAAKPGPDAGELAAAKWDNAKGLAQEAQVAQRDELSKQSAQVPAQASYTCVIVVQQQPLATAAPATSPAPQSTTTQPAR